MLLRLDGEVRVIMDATGVYHLPILMYLKEHGFFVSVVNPYEMKKYRSQGLRRVKTDKQDAITICKYGLDYWYRLKNYKANGAIYDELKLSGRQLLRIAQNACKKCTEHYAFTGLCNAQN